MFPPAERTWPTVAYWVSWGLVVALYIFWPLTHLGVYAWSNDEGLYVQRAALANAGYSLYTQVLFNKPPLLIWILQAAFRLAGQTLAVARLTSLGMTLVGVLALGWVARQLWGRWAGVATAALWVAMPEVPLRAHAVMSDLPALSFALVSLGAASALRRRGQRVWLVLSGAAYASALLIHPLLIYLALPLAAILYLPAPGSTCEAPTRVKVWPDLAILLGVGASLGLLVLTAIDRKAFLTWVLRYNYRTASVVRPTALSASWDLIVDYLRRRWALVCMAGLGAVVLCIRPVARRGLVVVATWLLATVGILLVWSPLWMHYLLFVALPLVIMAGGGLAGLGQWAISRRTRGDVLHWLYAATTALVLICGAYFALGRWRADSSHLNTDRRWSHDRLMAREFIRCASAPDDFIVTDDPLLAFTAGRLIPPALTEASYRHIYLGYLTAGDLVASALRHEAPIVLFGTGRLEELPSFEHWVQAMSRGRRREFGALRAYELHPADHARKRMPTRLGDAITLEAYAVSDQAVRPGSVFTTTLFWKSDGQVSEDYHVFVHLLDKNGRLMGQHDGPPLLEAYPTSEWAQDLLLPDPHPFVIGLDLPSGGYQLVAGMYRWPSLERLPAYRDNGRRWRDDLIVLTEIEVLAP